MVLSLNQVKKLALQSQGLLKTKSLEKNQTLDIIKNLGYIQLDTLSVISRAHHHTIWTRFENYQESFINELLEKDKTIFEYWSHAASYLPMSDYRFSLIKKKAYSEGKNHWFDQDKNLKAYVLDRIKSEGALQSKDFEHKSNSVNGWYDWKPAKKALEQLFMEGELMIAKRKGFQKVYDLTERVLPKNINTTMPTIEEYCKYLIDSYINANGVVLENEISYLRNKIKTPINKEIKKLLKEGELINVSIEGLEKLTFLTTKNKLAELEKITSSNYLHFLSPFDNSVIQRKRIQRFFNFDYMIECYLPEPKRKYGYFTLPILFNDNFVGRFDPKANRNEKTFYVKSIHFEEGFKPNELFNNLFVEKLKTFAKFNGCEKIIINTVDQKWKKEIESYFE